MAATTTNNAIAYSSIGSASRENSFDLLGSQIFAQVAPLPPSKARVLKLGVMVHDVEQSPEPSVVAIAATVMCPRTLERCRPVFVLRHALSISKILSCV